MSTIFISDLHLDPIRPAAIRAFLTLLTNKAGHCDALYILGDFFELWIGDDDDSALSQEITTALAQFTDSGTPLYIMHGNRDFLLGQRFAETTGAQLIEDPILIQLYGKSVLLAHGDALCIDDHEYMQFRQLCRQPQWQQAQLEQPLEQRRQLAMQMRAESQAANSNKADAIMDVNTDEVLRVMGEFNTDLLIHGHTHRPAIHKLELDRKPAQRIVLGDWDQSGWILEYFDDHTYQLKEFTIQ